MQNEESLVDAVARIKLAQPSLTAAAVHEQLSHLGVSLSQVKKASSKAAKRGLLVGAAANPPTDAADPPADAPASVTESVDPLEAASKLSPASMECVAAAFRKGLTDPRAYTSGEVAANLGRDHSGMTPMEAVKEGKEMEYMRNALDHCKRVNEAVGERQPSSHSIAFGKALAGKRVVGVIRGDEPPATRARMWVDLLLEPSGRAVLGQ